MTALGTTTQRESVFAGWRGALLLTGVTALSAQLSFHIAATPVPVTFQVFAVLLSGLLLGARWGAVAQLQYLLLGLAGAPVFALGHSGLHTLLGFTGGYLLSYPLAAFLVGKMAGGERIALQRQALACLVGVATIYCVGMTWLGVSQVVQGGVANVLIAGMGWFVVWDAVKASCAIGVSQALRPRPSPRKSEENLA
jgi:biotin transport system substrate-specific component